MLELRPTCENCNKPLPPESTEALICTFECTFCRDCVENVISNVCPNCGGGFVTRPIRPKANLNDDNYLGKYPPSENIRHKPVDAEKHKKFSENIKKIPPESR